jgi:replicative superfamily II helicase
MYVLPFVSIVTEKQQYLSKICENINLKIIALHSQSKPLIIKASIQVLGESVWSPGVDIAICTIEKANSLMNRVIEEKVYFDISFFIIDEFHLVWLNPC